MDCGMGCVKYLLFFFNFFFVLSGLAILTVGVIIHLQVTQFADILSQNVTVPAVTLIIIGSIIFIIAFFGCCGAIRENHCMTITFAVILLTILIIQVAIAVYTFVVAKDISDQNVKESYNKIFNTYWNEPTNREVIDVIQSSLKCCGVTSYTDFYNTNNGTIPWSCCGGGSGTVCTTLANIYDTGCVNAVIEFIKYAGKILGGLAIGVAAFELFGVIFALCLANSIRNTERRGYRV